MIKKHFIFAADYIVESFKDLTLDGAIGIGFKYTGLLSYEFSVKLFQEFGKNFDIDKFNSYIEKKINKP